MKVLQVNRLGMFPDKLFVPVSGLMEGNDWTPNEQTGEWLIPSAELPEEQIKPDMTYTETFLIMT